MSTLLTRHQNGPRRLRELLTTSDLIVAPGAFDCLSARLIEAAGFPAVYMTGFGTAATYLGRPDVGLLGMSEMVEKIRAAVAARSSPDFVVIARTDARAVEGLETAIERAQRYREAGADLLFVEAPESESDIERVASALRDVPLLFNWAEGGKTPPLTLPRLRELGFRVVIFPIGALLVAARAIRDLMHTLVEHGTPAPALDRMVPFKDFIDFLGIAEIRALEQR